MHLGNSLASHLLEEATVLEPYLGFHNVAPMQLGWHAQVSTADHLTQSSHLPQIIPSTHPTKNESHYFSFLSLHLPNKDNQSCADVISDGSNQHQTLRSLLGQNSYFNTIWNCREQSRYLPSQKRCWRRPDNVFHRMRKKERDKV